VTRALQYTADALSTGSLYALFACGLALVLSVARIANFAYGDVMMVAAYMLLVTHSLPWPLVVVVVILIGTVINVGIDLIAFRPLRRADGVSLLVTSFGVSILIQNVVELIAGARPESVNFGGSFDQAVNLGGVRVARIDFLTMAVTALVLSGLWLFLRRSLIGMQLRAASEDFTMSRLAGVRANRVIAVAFAISGAIAGIAATLLTMQSGSLSTDMGLQPTLIAFIAVVIGGMGSIPGATLGGLLLGVVSVVLQATLPAGMLPYHDAILFSAVIFMLLARPQGLFGGRVAAERV
jgi:branched-chain amino acid transport system permease protein